MIILDILSIILVIVILGIIITYLISINRRLNQKIEQEKNRFILYKKKLSELETKQNFNKNDFEILNKLARDFFKERFDLNYTLSYLEISEIFKKEGLDERVQFCDRMAEILYAGDKIDEEVIKNLIHIFQDIVEDYKYL
jgi:hypothetical protein